MDLLGNYDDSNDEGSGTEGGGEASSAQPKVQRPDRRYLQAAPSISVMTKRRHGQELIVRVDPATNMAITEPIQGPAAMDPHDPSTKAGGKAEANVEFDLVDFKKQRAQFQKTGKALAPGSKESTVVRTALGYNRTRLEAFEKEEQERRKRPKFDTKEKEPLVYGSDDEAEYGIWAPPSKEERWNAENNLTDVQKGGLDSLAPEQLAEREYIKERDRLQGAAEEEKEDSRGWEQLMERKMGHLLPPQVNDEPSESTTTFHGKEETNYKGLSWVAPPAGMGSLVASNEPLEMDHHKCFVPKKCVHRFTGHNKGVHRIRLFPKTGHLLLSGGLDGKCKVWSVVDKKIMRTYEGHTAGVRDVQFNHDGSKFVSASFDRFLRLWDTESGKVLQTFTNKKVPYCVEFYPHDDNFFVVGCSDNKIITYDATSGEITQEYNHHLAPVNSIVFVEDNGTKMVTSGDDKKVLVWEWDIGVPIKYISDPTMHSMPCLVMHPSLQYFAAQSLDNTICVFQAGNRFAMQKKKKFSGHQVAGYACEPAISPDGQFLVSGDGKGKLCFWEWKRSKMLQKYRAHDSGPAIACVWHPIEPSIVFSCGWDGIIKMWQ
jgi:pre-mRNA-processing factor 17